MDILSVLIPIRATSGLFLEWTPNVDLLRIAEKLLGLQPGDGAQALRMIHFLVHIPGWSLMSDVADDDFSPTEDHYRGWGCDRVPPQVFHWLPVGPTRVGRTLVWHGRDEHAPRTCMYSYNANLLIAPSLRLACSAFPLIFTNNTLPLTPISVTWGHATLSWTHHITQSGVPQPTLLQALLSFDVLEHFRSPNNGTWMSFYY